MSTHDASIASSTGSGDVDDEVGALGDDLQVVVGDDRGDLDDLVAVWSRPVISRSIQTSTCPPDRRPTGGRRSTLPAPGHRGPARPVTAPAVRRPRWRCHRRAGSGRGRAAGSAGPARTRPRRRPSRQPPQNGGRGTSTPAKRGSASSTSRSSSPRSASTVALRRRPGAELAAAGPGPEVGVALGVVDALDRAAQTDLAVQVEPGEHRRGVRVGGELAALDAVEVGVEDEASARRRRGRARRGRRGGRRGPPWRPPWRWAR